METLTITHSHAEGTLIDGTARGDGSAEVLKAAGWRWSRALGCWFVRGSRDRMANRPLIDRTADALRAAGFVVVVEVDDTRRRAAEVEADKVARWSARAEALTGKADRQSAAAAALVARADADAEAWPLGQPLISDQAVRSWRKMQRAHEKGWRASVEAQQTAERARVAEAHISHHESPYTVANRIDRLAAELRRLERAGAIERAEQLRDEVAHWQGVRAGQIARGEVVEYGPETVKAGDLVQISGGWWTVYRANPTTVTLRSLGCQTRTPYHQIRDHKSEGGH